MTWNVKATCDRFAELVSCGDVASLSDMHIYPCPFIIDGRMIVLPDRSSFMMASALWSAELANKGVRSYSCDITAQELPRGRQFRVWLRWWHHMADGSVTEAGDDVVFFARQPDGRLLVEMVEVVSRTSGFETLPAVAIG